MLTSTLALIAGQALLAQAAAPSAFSTSSDGSLKNSARDAPVSGAGNANGVDPWKLTMDDTSSGARQVIDGFGSAVTDSTLLVYNKLSDDLKAQFVKDMVASDGGNFQLVRHTIASSDLSPNFYSYDDNNGQEDPNLDSFNLGDSGNDQAGLLAAFRKAQSQLTILGSSWHAPDWMRNPANVNNYLNPQWADAFAQYFVKYLQAFESAGAHIDAITIQNEPRHDNPRSFTMGMTASDEVNYIKKVAPALQAANLNTTIWAFDHNTEYSVQGGDDFPGTVLNDAGQYTDTVAWHCYDSPDWSRLSSFRDEHNGVKQYMTECWTHEGESWNEMIGWVMGPLQNWAQGAIAWPMATTQNGDDRLSNGNGGLECDQCRGFATLSGDNNYNLELDYYLMAQYSKAIPNGAIYHTVDGNQVGDGYSGIDSISAINPDGTKTLVVMNSFGNDIYLTLDLKSGSSWSGDLPANSLTTWILPA